MSKVQMATCPRCNASFQVAAEQIEQAGGRVRCGNCLQIFDAIHGEMDFIAPQVPEEGEDLFAGIEVAPMAVAELPDTQRSIPWGALTVLLALLALLGAQFYLPVMRERAALQSVELSKLVVRPHPDVEGALRVDAVIRNRTAEAVPYPLLVLGFTNRQGEPRARRAFRPAEYLHGNQPLLLPARSDIQVSLALADPGSDAVNYVARLQLVTASPD